MLLAAACSCGPAVAGPYGSLGHAAPNDGGAVRKVAVFGRDERVAIPARMSALRQSVGLIYSNEARSVCTAFCVADNVVATAAHCLFRTAGERPPRLGQFRFTLHAERKRPSSRIAGYRSGTVGQVVVAGSTELRIEPPIDATSDWALVRLASPICRGGKLAVLPATPEQVTGYADRQKLLHVAFHKDFPKWQLASSDRCSAETAGTERQRRRIERDFKERSRLVLHTCDTGDASSGSPLLAELASGAFAVVGINVGTYVQTRLLIEKGRVVRRYKADPIANTAIAASAFQNRIAAVATAKLLTSRRKLRLLQEALRSRHFYTGPRDGRFRPQLRIAIENYERANGLPAIGLATVPLLGTLMPPRKLARGYGKSPRRYQRLSRGRLTRRFRVGSAGRTRPPKAKPAPVD
ncbi:MAG: trypsin-like peptidase domain-containing protein [Hyphomicrobiaceae bacterium]|nr:trypsin-like peptidase domain-containing protein [Hyphomicrobiaceae bacterium]